MFRRQTETEPRAEVVARGSSMSRTALFEDFPDVVPQPGTMLVRTRAISARVNKNYDGFSSAELKKAYKTFMGRPSFVNHKNLNFRQTRGIVRGSVYKEAGPDKWIDLLIEIDARQYPKLAAEVEAGRLDGVSMGCFLAGTLIAMKDGTYKDIVKVAVDDEVITHNSNIETITYVTEKYYTGVVYEIEAYDLFPVWATQEHPFWVRPGTMYADARWVEAADVQVDDWVLTPEKALKEGEKKYIDGQTWPTKEGLWRRVSNTTARDHSGPVYNFDVDGDDSYVANGIAVHNCDVQRTICSFCDNVAKDPYEFCSHILYHKGQTLERVNNNFEKEAVLVYERCEGVNFFEISFVFDPADETALIQEVYVPGGYYSSSQNAYEYDVIPKLGYGDTIAPPQVDTMRKEKNCPQCGDENYDGEECQLCEYKEPPDELKDPDLDRAKKMDLRQKDVGDPASLDRQARRFLSNNPFVRRS